jgi:hypothetical protein
MAETCSYRSETLLSVPELAEFDRRLSREVNGYLGFEPGSCQNVYLEDLESLPELPALTGAKLGRTVIFGRLRGEPWDAFREVLWRAPQLLPSENSEVQVGFEERESRQGARAYDTVSSTFRAGQPFFCYGANGSRVAKEPSYARSFLAEVIEALELPLELTTEGEEYFLRHSRGGTLHLPRKGSRNQNPKAFHCALDGATGDELADLMQAFLTRFASDKRLNQSWQIWTASNLIFKPMPGAEELYRAVREADFPADQYELHLTVFIEGLEGLDLWQGLVSGETQIFTEVGSVELSKTNWLKTGVVTTSEGHRLDVETRLEMDPAEIEEVLGVKVEQVS